MGIINDIVETAQDVTEGLGQAGEDIIEKVSGEAKEVIRDATVVAEDVFDFAVQGGKPPEDIKNLYERKGYEYIDSVSVPKLCGLGEITEAVLNARGTIRLLIKGVARISLSTAARILGPPCALVGIVLPFTNEYFDVGCTINIFVFWQPETGDVELLPWCAA